MALITIGSNVFVDANQMTFGVTVVAVEAIAAGSACTLDANGKAKKAINTDTFVGFAVKSASIGKPVTLYRMARITEYASGITPAMPLYMAGVGNAGKLSDAPIVAGDPVVAVAVSATDLVIA